MASTIPYENITPIRVKGIDLNQCDLIKERLVDLLKIDAEGGECDVIKASEKLIKISKYVLIEASISRPSSGDIIELCHLLKGMDPSVKVITLGRIYCSGHNIDAVDILFGKS